MSSTPRMAAVLLVVAARDGGDPALARLLARRLGLPVAADAAEAELELCLTAQRLELRQPGGRTGPVFVDLLAEDVVRRRRQAGRRSEPLARAVGLGKGPPPRVLDATAGLGRDSLLLAWLGCEVTAVERHPVVAALLEDGLRRAAADPVLGPVLSARLRLRAADARAVLAEGEPPDVLLLDPMFPRQRRTALARKELTALRRLVGADEDADELLAAALAVARRRVVVKRPAHAPPLGGRPPQVQIPGASTRLDVYLTTR